MGQQEQDLAYAAFYEAEGINPDPLAYLVEVEERIPQDENWRAQGSKLHVDEGLLGIPPPVILYAYNLAVRNNLLKMEKKQIRVMEVNVLDRESMLSFGLLTWVCAPHYGTSSTAGDVFRDLRKFAQDERFARYMQHINLPKEKT